MKIRKLELQGFKSFADRATLHFGPGISGVVGPNGCGKSNIMDAVRWCIGEQSAKSLRGDSMSDVIFAGSASRHGVSFAEVSLTFVAGDEPFPGIWQRFPELEVTRRLYKDGGSDYLVNNERVRLRDVNDLFMDTGVGNRLYSFIEQGRIGQIVHARAQDRRTLIEEAAGISRYKARREESLDKLSNTREALEKVADLHDDLGRTMKSAERQVTKALRAASLDARLRQVELTVALARFGGLAGDRKALGDRVRVAAAELEEASRAVARHEEELDTRRRVLEAAEAEVGRLRDQLNQVEADRRVEESAAQYQRREIEGAARRLVQLARDLEDQRTERDAAGAEATRAGEAAAKAQAELSSVRAEAEVAAERLQAAPPRAGEARRALDEAKRKAQAALDAAVRTRGQAHGLQARRAELDARTERHRRAAAETAPSRASEELERVRVALAAVEGEAQGARATIEARRAAVGPLELARQKAIEATRAADLALTEATRERERWRARLESLLDMERRHVDLPDGVRAALAAPGAMGVVGEGLEIPAALENAVARALDGALDAVVVPDAATAVAVVAKAGQSRLRILPLELVHRGQSVATAPSASLGHTDAGRAAMAALLPDLAVVDTLTEALAAWIPGRTVAARDGAVVRRDALVVIGAESGAALASVRRRREIEEVRGKMESVAVAEREAAVVAGRAAQKETEAAVAAALAAVEEARAAARGIENQVGEARHRVREAEADALRAQRAAEALVREAELIAQAEAALSADRQRIETESLAAESRQHDAELAVRSEQVRLETVEPELQSAQGASSALRYRAESLQKDALGQAAAAEGARGRAERAARRVEQVAAETNDVERRRAALALEAEATAQKIQALGEAQGKVAGELEASRERAKVEKEKVRQEEAATRSARDRRDGAKDRHVEAEGALSRVRAEIEAVLGSAEEAHGISLPALLDRIDRDGALLVHGWEPREEEGALGAEPVPTARIDARALDLDDLALATRAKEAEALRHERFKIGETNPEAITEFYAAKTQFDDIDRQRADLESAMEVIESAIAKINQTCRERFRETFDLVNEHFAEIYPRLVGGGSAKLELTDDEDLLDCGVEMMVQPPGKKVQNLSLLSGGEKAMAAIGLIFSLFRVKPSPFCLLDEVDAPLDEGNGTRFNDMLKTMAANSQFIVITHNKKTMEAADVLYGITMPEPGASRLVSVKMEGA